MPRIPHSRPTLVDGMEQAVGEVVTSGAHAGGAVRMAFEDEFARRLSMPHAHATTSGFAGLHLALLALGVGPGDRVVVPSYVCASLLHAVAAVGGKCVVADVHPDFFNLTSETLHNALSRAGLGTDGVSCAIVPHIFGFPAPLHQWDSEIPVIEDGAMALGSRIGDDEVGGWGRLSIFSFYATKMISTGQGGMVMTVDPELAERVADRLAYDERPEWRPAFNYRMTDLAAALGRVQLGALERFLERRREVAMSYRDAFRNLPIRAQEVFPETTPNDYRFTILLDSDASRSRLERDLLAAGIEAKSPVYRPLHRYLSLDPRDFPATESIQARALSLPIYPSLTDDERDRVIEAVLRSLE